MYRESLRLPDLVSEMPDFLWSMNAVWLCVLGFVLDVIITRLRTEGH